MKLKLIFTITLITFLCCGKNKTKDSDRKNKENSIVFSNIPPLPPPPPITKSNDGNIICLSYSYSGKESISIETFTNLLIDKKYSIIQEKLNSKMTAERYLASIICKKLREHNLIKLSSTESNKLKENLTSSDKLFLYAGCTNSIELNMNEMSSIKNILKDDIEEWLNKLIENQ